MPRSRVCAVLCTISRAPRRLARGRQKNRAKKTNFIISSFPIGCFGLSDVVKPLFTCVSVAIHVHTAGDWLAKHLQTRVHTAPRQFLFANMETTWFAFSQLIVRLQLLHLTPFHANKINAAHLLSPTKRGPLLIQSNVGSQTKKTEHLQVKPVELLLQENSIIRLLKALLACYVTLLTMEYLLMIPVASPW